MLEGQVAVLSSGLLDMKESLEVLDALKADSRLNKIPVIVISAVEDGQSEEKCLELGAFGYLQKPVDIDELSDMLKQAHKKVHGDNRGTD